MVVAVNVEDLLALDAQNTSNSGQRMIPLLDKRNISCISHPERIHSVKPIDDGVSKEDGPNKAAPRGDSSGTGVAVTYQCRAQ